MSAPCVRHGLMLPKDRCPVCANAKERAEKSVRPDHETLLAVSASRGGLMEFVKVEDAYLIRGYSVERGRGRLPLTWDAARAVAMWQRLTGDSAPAWEWHAGRMP